MNLSSRWEIDFILDCGADPTGATSSGPALNRAGVLLTALAASTDLLPEQAITLRVPPGLYLISGTLSVWDFTSGPTKVRILGDGDGSIFQLNCPGQSALAISNPVDILIEDLSFVGTQQVPSSDCADAIYLAPQAGFAILKRVHIDWVRGSRSLIYVNTGSLRLENCRFTGSGSDTAALNIPNSIGQLDVVDTDWIAESHLNGFASPSAQWKSYSPNLWCKVIGAGTITEGYVQAISFRRCQFDWSENLGAIVIQGNSPNPIDRVRIEDCLIYPSQFGSPQPAVNVTGVNFLDIDGLTNVGDAALSQVFVSMTAVARARLRAVDGPVSDNNVIDVDVTSGSIELDSCAAPIVTSLASSAARTLVTAGASAPSTQSNTGKPFTGQQLFTTTLPGSESVTVAFPMTEGSFAGRISVVGRLITPGTGLTPGDLGDYYGADFFLKCKTITGTTTVLASAADGAAANDASLAGVVVTIAASTNTVTVEVDATAAPTGTGALIDWIVTLFGEANLYHVTTPSEVAGLTLLLDARRGVTTIGSAVSEWDDQTGSDPNKNCLQTTAGDRPTLNDSNASFAGEPTIDFNGTTDYLVSSAWTTPQAQPFTAFFVGLTSKPDPAIIGLDNLAAHQTSIQSNATIPGIYAGATLLDTSGGDFNNPTIVGALFDGASSQLWINQKTGQAAAAAGGNNLQGTTIGGFGAAPGNTTNAWEGSIAFIAVYKRALTAKEMDAVLLYLSGRFGIALGP